MFSFNFFNWIVFNFWNYVFEFTVTEFASSKISEVSTRLWMSQSASSNITYFIFAVFIHMDFSAIISELTITKLVEGAHNLSSSHFSESISGFLLKFKRSVRLERQTATEIFLAFFLNLKGLFGLKGKLLRNFNPFQESPKFKKFPTPLGGGGGESSPLWTVSQISPLFSLESFPNDIFLVLDLVFLSKM